ncbi:MAG: hypothetical protein ACH346_03055 [Chthoniobacterales bacterium]
MITKKGILSFIALAGFSAAAMAQLTPPPHHGPGGQWPTSSEAAAPIPSYETYHWQMLCSSNAIITGQIVGIAYSLDQNSYITVASDGLGSNYSAYLLQKNNLEQQQNNVTQEWKKVGTFSNFRFGRIYYDLVNDEIWNAGSAFKILGRDLNDQPKMILSNDNGSTWQEAKFITVGSDHDIYLYRFVDKDGKLQFSGVPASACDEQEPIYNPYFFAAVGYEKDLNGDQFVAIDNDGSTYVTVGSDASE